MKKSFMVVLAIGLLAAAVLPAAPAQAAGAGVAECSVTVDPWPGSGSNAPCVGTAPAGAFVSGGNTIVCSPLTPCAVNASVDNYGEECLGAEPPLIGDARGTLTISQGANAIAPQYSWTRVGLVAVITTTGPTGAGVAAFLPVDTTIPTCASPGALDVRVVGIAAFLN